MAILNELSEALSTSLKNQLGLAENTPGSLDANNRPYGKLGDFADRIDQSAHRRYIETGTIRDLKPRAMEIISQQPEITILIKKRIFSSLQENYRLDLLDEEELMFIRATKALFQKKCQAIAAYERLTKLQNIVSKNDGIISDYALPAILTAYEDLENLGVPIDGKTKSTLDAIKRVKAFSDPNFFTTWLNDQTVPYASPQGPGTGVIELTTVAGAQSKTSVEFGSGSASLNIEDPYKLTLITNDDIEDAIAEANNLFSQNNFFRLTESQLRKSIETLKSELNRIRRNSGASEIRFVIAEDTIISKKVRAFFDSEGREIQFTFDAGTFGLDIFAFNPDSVSLDPSALEGINGLQGPEIDLFKKIVNDIFIYTALKQTSRSEIKQYNERTNRVRRKMRIHYGSKSIIQPMDVVYIYINSKTAEDPLISQGLRESFSASNLVNAIDQGVGNIEAAFDQLKSSFSGGTQASSYLETEKNAIAGPSFPMWLWNIMRNDFTRQGAGTCVFTGIVSSRNLNYSGGKYTVSINVNDNTHYFNKGNININPSVDVFNSALYDPLTPFKTDFDLSSGLLRGEVPELLDTNIRLLNSGSIRAKIGRFKGTPVDQEKYNKTEVEFVASGLGHYNGHTGRDFRRKFTDPDGFVYQWKEGIGSLVLFGEPYSDLTSLGSFSSETSPLITRDPFAGQDTMNVLSLLITGIPYNYTNFVRGALEHSNISRDDLFNEVISSSFFKGLIRDVTRNNSIWGNFIPFKKLVVNEREYDFLISGQFDIINRNRELSKLIRRRAEVFDELTAASESFGNTSQFYQIGQGGDVSAVVDTNNSGIAALSYELNRLDAQISAYQEDFEQHLQEKAIQSPTGTLQIIGDDVTFDPTLTGVEHGNTEAKRRLERAQLRKNLNYLSLRRLWAVKANEDQNFFIVDDSYDKNYDIQQFERALSGQMEKFKSNYTNTFEQIDIIRKILGLEVYADTQGHIRARAPQYNRMPSSVYRQMLQEKAQRGIKIFPEYLESLFFNTIQGITDQLEIVEDQIRLRAAALGYVTDKAAATNLLGGGVTSKGSNFTFLTKEDGKFGGENIRKLLFQSNPDLSEETASRALESINTEISAPLNATINFDITRRLEVASQQISFDSNFSNVNNRIEKISKRLKSRTRDFRIPSSVQDVFSSTRLLSKGGRSQSDILKVTSEIADYVAERQRLIKRLAPAVTNLREGLSVNDPNASTAQSLLLPNLVKPSEDLYPDLLESMIEDENNHDLGEGSGNRFIIKDSQIISFDLQESEPPYTSVQVNGRLGQGLVNFPTGLELSNGGNAIGTAWAVDYTMWQMYGLRHASPVDLPFFQDPTAQCAPYGVYLLNLSRKQIHSGSITIVGNEFIQPGEVYYVEDYDLLFYAESVSHNFQYNGQFTTTIELTFGHTPGEYIPTQLDVIGKGLYTHRHQAELVRQVRHNRADDSRALTVVIWDGQSVSDVANNVQNLVSGSFGEQNRKNLGNMMLATSGLLTPTTSDRTLNLEVRLYQNSDLNLSPNKNLGKIAVAIKEWLIDPRKVSLDGQELLPEKDNRPKIDPDRIKIRVVDLGKDVKESDSPSSMAWSSARLVTSSGSTSGLPSITTENESQAESGEDVSEDRITELKELGKRDAQSLINSVIDVWAVFSDPVKIKEESSK